MDNKEIKNTIIWVSGIVCIMFALYITKDINALIGLFFVMLASSGEKNKITIGNPDKEDDEDEL